jgi:hypothetical protein
VGGAGGGPCEGDGPAFVAGGIEFADESTGGDVLQLLPSEEDLGVEGSGYVGASVAGDGYGGCTDGLTGQVEGFDDFRPLQGSERCGLQGGCHKDKT